MHPAPSPPNEITPRPPYLFFGPNGLRAGWSLLIAAFLFYTIFTGATTLAHKTHLLPSHAMENNPTPLPVFVSEFIAFLSIALVTWIMSKIERRPVAVYGLGGQHKLLNLLTGLVWGVLFLSLIVLLLMKSGLLIIDGRLLFGSDILRYALEWIPGFLAIGFFEEYFFRGYLQYTLSRCFAGLTHRFSASINPQAAGFWTAAVLVSFGFGAVHGNNPGESPLGLLCAGLASLVFCLSLWRTGSLWWAIGLHAAWDWAQSYLYGVADSGATFRFHFLSTHPIGAPLLSGGTTGPEGSIFVFPVLLLLSVVIFYTLPSGTPGYAANLPPFSASSPDTGSLPDQAPVPPFEVHRH